MGKPVERQGRKAASLTPVFSYNSRGATGMCIRSMAASITKASDDAADLAIGTRIQKDVAVLSQAATNASQATAILQTVDGGLARISDITLRMRALAVQSASGSVTNDERVYIASEFNQLNKEITDIAKNTRYNGASLLDGSYGDTAFMIGTSSNDNITISMEDSTSKALGLNELDVATGEGAQAALEALDKAADQLSEKRAAVGATMSRFEFKSDKTSSTPNNLQPAVNTAVDAEVAADQTMLASIRTYTTVAALTQANQMPQNLLNLLK